MIRCDQNSVRALGSRAVLLLLALAALLLPAPQASAQPVPPTCPRSLGTATIISHDFNVSFCELCDQGTVRIVIQNPFRRSDDVDFSDLVITENLRASGLTYVVGTTRFGGSNITPPPAVEPIVSGPDGRVLTWTLSSGFVLDGNRGGPRNRRVLTIEFDVERHSNVTEEGLVLANRTIEANVELTPSCAPGDRFTSYSGPGILPLDEPEPRLSKAGRNVDAVQGGYSSNVYGHEDDDVIWRIRVQNDGDAPLQDFEFSDEIVPGNFEFRYVCDDAGDAANAASGGPTGDCIDVSDVGTVTEVLDLDVAEEFGDGANPYIVAPAGGRRFYYFVGKVTDSCTNRNNTVFDGAWGCQIESPAGDITATSNGTTAGSDADMLRTRSVETGVNVNVSLTGVNTSQPMGGTGTVTIEISNQSNGTITAGLPGIRLRDLLPAEYVIDSTFVPTVTVTNPAYGDYLGRIDTVAWTNPVGGTVPLTTNDPALPLSNTDLQFVLSSTTEHPDYPGQHMIRHGDVVTVTFRTVLIDPQYYDKVANLDVRTEAPDSDPLWTDPTESFPISNHLEMWYEEFCTPNEHHLAIDDTAEARPEDLDANIVGNRCRCQ